MKNPLLCSLFASASFLSFSAHAEVPEYIQTVLDMGIADAILFAGNMLVVVIAVAALKFVRRGV